MFYTQYFSDSLEGAFSVSFIKLLCHVFWHACHQLNTITSKTIRICHQTTSSWKLTWHRQRMWTNRVMQPNVSCHRRRRMNRFKVISCSYMCLPDSTQASDAGKLDALWVYNCTTCYRKIIKAGKSYLISHFSF